MNIRRDILTLEENTLGKDYIMADLHGNADCLNAMLQKLKPEDRLFIAGDLTDRGTDSPSVIRLILDYQAKHPDKLYIIYGNHEDSNVDAISAMADCFEELAAIKYSKDDPSELETYAINLRSRLIGYCDNQLNDLLFCLESGGFWLLELFKQEMEAKYLFISAENSLKDTEDSLIGKYYKLVSNLPYIIHVKGRRPFTIVHADMPFSQQQLLAKLANNNTSLTTNEKIYAMNARTPHLDASGQLLNADKVLITALYKNPHDMINYTGHNIVNNEFTFVTRPESNTANLDVATFLRGAALVACHTDATCQYVGLNVAESCEKFPLLNTIKEKLADYLKADAARYEFHCDENIDSINSPAGSPVKRNRSPSKLNIASTLFDHNSPNKELKLDSAGNEANKITPSGPHKF